MNTYIQTTTLYLGTCKTCNRPYRVDFGDKYSHATLTVYTNCPGCENAIEFQRLAAVTTEEACNANCMDATGPDCSCACGGTNHGASWGNSKSVTTYELEAAIKKYRTRQEREEQKRQQRRQAKERRTERLFAEWVKDGNQDIVDYLNSLDPAYIGNFLTDMIMMIIQQKPLTDNQANAVRQIVKQDADRKAKQATYGASKKAAPLGKGITVEGTIISIKGEQDRYSYYDKKSWKMTVECDGYRVWGTVPSILVRNPLVLQGQRVRFVANLEPSKSGDPSFVIAKNPRGAVKL